MLLTSIIILLCRRTIGRSWLARGNKTNDLYILNCEDIDQRNHVNNISVEIWHPILGHLSFKKMDSLKNYISCIATSLNKYTPYHIWPLSRQQILPFVSNNNLFKHAFHLIHCDIWEPFHNVSHLGHFYFLWLMITLVSLGIFT